MVIGYCAALACFPDYWWTCTLCFGLPFSYIAIQNIYIDHDVMHGATFPVYEWQRFLTHPFADFVSLPWEEFVLEHNRHHASTVDLLIQGEFGWDPEEFHYAASTVDLLIQGEFGWDPEEFHYALQQWAGPWGSNWYKYLLTVPFIPVIHFFGLNDTGSLFALEWWMHFPDEGAGGKCNKELPGSIRRGQWGGPAAATSQLRPGYSGGGTGGSSSRHALKAKPSLTGNQDSSSPALSPSSQALGVGVTGQSGRSIPVMPSTGPQYRDAEMQSEKWSTDFGRIVGSPKGGARVASFVRLNGFLLRTHITSLLSALAEDGWLEAWEKERLCSSARDAESRWAQSFLQIYMRFVETDDVATFVAGLKAQVS
eukprot:s5127_g1.t1